MADFLLLLSNVAKSITLLSAYLISAGFTQGIKYAFFGDADRPSLIFEIKHLPLKLVNGVDMHIHHSFPSGHATAAFSMFFCISFFTPNKTVQVLSFFSALLVAFSRVYLSQHFCEDITAGSFIGIYFSLLVCYLLYETKLGVSMGKIQKPIFKLFS